uniref:Uncharacterized protein n=1 Tax=Monodelphis domestica TaxID=13616 RepID=A0A5F8GUH5_MONDO
SHNQGLYLYENILAILLVQQQTSHVFQPSFFVVYNMVTTEEIAVFENTSDKLLELFENFCDLFRKATLDNKAVQFPCSASSNNFARQIQHWFKDTIINAKYGGHTEAVWQLLGQLPISAVIQWQSLARSSLFSYDDKWMSIMEQPKTCGDHPIRFYAQDSGLLKFEIQAGLLGCPINHTIRHLVALPSTLLSPLPSQCKELMLTNVVNFHMQYSCT